MSESGGEKRFDATPSRLAKARRDGNLPQAAELCNNAAFLAAIAATCAVAPAFAACARSAIAVASRGGIATAPLLLLGTFALIPFAGAAGAGAVAALLQHGGVHAIAVLPKLERLHPVEGLKRILSRETVQHSLRAALAFLVASAAATPGIRALAALWGAPPLSVAAACGDAARTVSFTCAGIGLLFGVAEFAAARSAWLKKLRMSFDDLKRDVKEQEGDPWTRSRRRSMHRSLLRGSIAKVKEASFVVVNPQHVAIALQYAPPAVPVPVVLVRATDAQALRVRAIAAQFAIPVVENVALARALLRDGDAGLPIPSAHYVAVAEIIAALARTRQCGGNVALLR